MFNIINRFRRGDGLKGSEFDGFQRCFWHPFCQNFPAAFKLQGASSHPLPSSFLPTHSLTIEADIATAEFESAQAASLSMSRIPRALSFSDMYISLRPLSSLHGLLFNINPLPCSATFPSLLVYPIPILFLSFRSSIFEPRLPPWLASHPGQWLLWKMIRQSSTYAWRMTSTNVKRLLQSSKISSSQPG